MRARVTDPVGCVPVTPDPGGFRGAGTVAVQDAEYVELRQIMGELGMVKIGNPKPP